MTKLGNSSMTIDKDELRDIMHEIFEERNRSELASCHQEHHEWIRERIEKDIARKEMYKEVTKSALQYSIPALLAGAYYWLHGQMK